MTPPALAPWSAGGKPSPDGRLRWRSMGEGPVLVLLHKLGGWIAEWETLAVRMPGRRVVALDLPGHGAGAGRPPHVQAVEDSAARVLLTLDGLGIEVFDLGGASLGGAVAVAVAAAQPRVRRLALISVALTDASDMVSMQQADAKWDGTLYGPGDIPLDRSASEAQAMFGFSDPALAEAMNRSRAAAGPWVRASWRGASLAEVRGRLPAVTAPTLLVYGERGGAGYAAHQATGLALLPDARATEIAEASAFPHEDRPDLLADVLDRFLTG